MDPERVCQPCRRLPEIEDGGLERRGGDSTAPPVKSSYENLTGSLKQALWSPKKYPSLDQMHEPTDSCSFQSDDGAPRVVWNPRIMSLCFSISASLEEYPMTPQHHLLNSQHGEDGLHQDGPPLGCPTRTGKKDSSPPAIEELKKRSRFKVWLQVSHARRKQDAVGTSLNKDAWGSLGKGASLFSLPE